jgi:hypothetical protein
LARNPSMPKGEAFAIATSQGHALGRNPRGYGTAEGKREAKAKYRTPEDDVKAANPGHLESSKLAFRMGSKAFKELLEAGVRNRRALVEYKDKKKKKEASDAEHLVGGRADGLPDQAVDRRQLRMGVREEREHTSVPSTRKEIAKDHLVNIPDYYTRLKRMEAGAPKCKESAMRIALYKEAFQVSQWSGELGPHGGGPYPSGIPPFRRPNVVPEKTAGPPGEREKRSAAGSALTTLRLLMIKRRADQGKGPWEMTTIDPAHSLPGLAKHGRSWQAMAKAAMLTPGGQLAASQRRFNTPLANPVGPSIATVARPRHAGLGASQGHVLPEAVKA